MTKRGRYSSILGLISLILIITSTGCQPAPAPATLLESTATPTQPLATTTATHRPTPTPANTPTRTPAFTSITTPASVDFPTFISTPNQPIASYQLKSWSEIDSTAMINSILSLDYNFSTSGYHEDVSNLEKARIILSAERLLRYPDSPDWYEWAWALADIEPKGVPLPKMRQSQTFFSFLVEHLLNDESVNPENLPSILDKYGFSIYASGSLQESTLKIENFFGNNAPAYFFIADINANQLYGSLRGIFIINSVNGMYQVRILDGWKIYGNIGFVENDTLQAGDAINGNHLPELIVEEHPGWYSGGYSGDSKILEIFEWSPLDNNIKRYDVQLYESFSKPFESSSFTWQWEFGSRNENGMIPIIITRNESDKNGNAMGTKQQFIQTWDDIKQHPVPQEKWTWTNTSLIGNADRRAQQLLFAVRNYPETIYYLNELLYSLTPVSLNYPDRQYSYFHYLLGLAYEMNGESDQAVQTYYKVWQEAPESVFGMAARFKLEPIR